MNAVLIALNNIYNAIVNLVSAVGTILPASGTISHSATTGSDTLPLNPSGFVTVTINGTAYKIPLYNP